MPPNAARSRSREIELAVRIEDFEKFIFIVGAPRSGTTTMSRWLQAHPQVAFPFVKEPHFFAQHDLRGLPDGELRRRVENDYLSYFFEPKPGQVTAVDGSVSYLYAPEQLEPALKLWPQSRFIVGVRDPMELLPSLHKRLIYTGDENITRFEDAWAAIADRAAGRRIPRSCIDPRWLRYDEAARYATYLERLFAAVGQERCMVVVHDDLASDPAKVHRELLRFAGLTEMPLKKTSASRTSRGVRYVWLQQLLKRPPKFLHGYLAGQQYRQRFSKDEEQDEGKPGKVSLRKRLLRWNRIDDERRPIPAAVQQEMRDRFKGEVDRLGSMIGRDLSHWLQPRAD